MSRLIAKMGRQVNDICRKHLFGDYWRILPNAFSKPYWERENGSVQESIIKAFTPKGDFSMV